MALSRRQLFVVAAAAGVAASTLGRRLLAAEDLEARDIELEGAKRAPRRFVLLVPRHPLPAPPMRLLVLLHGLGETGDQRTGAWAWPERYGLTTSYERLRRPPVTATTKRAHLTPDRCDAINALLAARPFRGMAIACPYVPDVYQAADREATLDAYASWIAAAVLPRARREVPALGTGPEHTHLDGCSLGGYVGLEVFLRRPELFGAWGAVQGAFPAYRIPRYVERIKAALGRHGPRPIHLETSSLDKFLDANTALHQALAVEGIGSDLRVGVGPHDQPWLREAGALEMLLWHDRD